MSKVISVCNICNNTFYVDEEYVKADSNIYISPTQYKRIGKDGTIEEKTLKTWADWIMHVFTHCPKCRLQSPPQKCIDNYNKIHNKTKQE